ncbi:MAG TPA: STAS domain-containing protein [Abditibacteriaceae bacterium]
MDLRLRSRRTGSATVVEVGGEVELHSANQLRDELLRAGEAEHPCVVVDLSRVTFIDSTGLGVLVGALKRVREKGALSLVCPQRQVRRVFEITGLTKVFPMFDNLEAAVASCPTKLPAVRKAPGTDPVESEPGTAAGTNNAAGSTAAGSTPSGSEVTVGLRSSNQDEVQGGANE